MASTLLGERKRQFNESEFLHFGILRGVSIHSPIEDQYSKMYKPRGRAIL